MERILGLRRAQSAKGAGVLWLGRLPDWEEFALRAYKRCRGWATYDEHGAYPLGLVAVGGAVFGSAWAASHRRTEGLQGKCNITLELKEDEIVIIHGLTYWPLPRLSSEPAPDFDNERPRSWSPV